MASSVGAAVTNLIALIQGAVPSTISGGSVEVAFGELPTYESPVTLVITEVTGDQTPAEIGRNFRREETYSIDCQIVTWAGDQDYAKRFTDAVTLWNVVSVAIANNPWLSVSGVNDATAAVRYAEVGSFSVTPGPDELGQSRCDLEFRVRCSQRINSLE